MEDQYKLRFIPLGGVIGVTKNMYVYELHKNDQLQDILIVDCGIGFPQDKSLGVDFVIPDITYLKDKVQYIRGIVLTHGHEDHITALPYHYEALGRPKVYASKLTKMFVENKFREHNIRALVELAKYDQVYKFGDIKAEFVHTTHSIPDTTNVIIRTPLGNLYHGSDFKMDLTPPYGPPPDFYKMTKVGHEGVLCLLSDCLGSEREGLTLSESIVGQTFEDQMRKTRGKFIMTTFSSNISRIRQCVEAAIKFNRKIVFLGRSMRDNTKLSAQIGYLPIPESLFGKEDEVMKIPPNKVCLIVAGSQGQYGSALSKLAEGQNKNIKIKPGDTVVFSSDPIPGNETEVYAVIEELAKKGAEVVYSGVQEQLHASGHGNRDDLKFLIRFTNPKYFIPIGGTVRHQLKYKRMVDEMGYDKDKVFLLDEGENMWFTKTGSHAGEPVITRDIYVDAYGIGDVGNVVLRDRKMLSAEGMVVAVIIVDNMLQLAMKPKLVSRGFVFEEGEEELFEKAAKKIEKTLKDKPEKVRDLTSTRQHIASELEELFFKEKGRRPLVSVEIVQV